MQEFFDAETSNQGSLCSDNENSFGYSLSVSQSSQLDIVEFKVRDKLKCRKYFQ